MPACCAGSGVIRYGRTDITGSAFIETRCGGCGRTVDTNDAVTTTDADAGAEHAKTGGDSR